MHSKFETAAIIGNFNYQHRSPAWMRVLNEKNMLASRIDEPLSQQNAKKIWFRAQERFLYGPNFFYEKTKTRHKICQLNADLNIFHKSLAFNQDVIRIIKKRSSSINIIYNNDNICGPLKDKAYWRRLKSAVPEFDLILAYRHSCVENYNKMGAKDVFLLQSYYLPWLHYRKGNTNKEFDVVFLGHYENDGRGEILDNLSSKLDGKLIVKGVDWQKYKPKAAWSNADQSPVIMSEYAETIRGSKIALAFFSLLNKDDYTRRVFEIPACGALLMAPRTETLKSLYEEDVEAVYFSDQDELVDKVNFYIKNDQARSKIASNGHDRCLNSGYDIYSRMNEWLEYLKRTSR